MWRAAESRHVIALQIPSVKLVDLPSAYLNHNNVRVIETIFLALSPWIVVSSKHKLSKLGWDDLFFLYQPDMLDRFLCIVRVSWHTRTIPHL